jgi:peroxiredoxin
MTSRPELPLAVGDRAPSFSLPAVNEGGTVSLEDYRGRTPLLLGLFRGIHCPFCRRHLVQLAAVQPKLEALGVATVAIVNSLPERARLYFRYRPTRLVLVADADRASHDAFGVPTLRTLHGLRHEQALGILIDPTGELGGPKPGGEARDELNRRDRYEPTPQEDEVQARPQGMASIFLIDRGGVIQWRWIEAMQRAEDVGTFPSAAELLGAAQSMVYAERATASDGFRDG